MKMAKRLLCLAAALTMTAAAAAAEPARELDCELAGKNSKEIRYAADGKYQTYWSSLAGQHAPLRLTAPEGELIGSVYVQFYYDVTPFEVQTKDAAGEWKTQAVCENDMLAAFVPLEAPAQEIRIRPKDGRGSLRLAEVHAFTPGEKPGWVQDWEPMLDKADMLVLAAHPDDELLFLGGTIPTYAGARGLDVQVAYLVPSMPYRRLELLDGLWHCGVRHYPAFGGFPDRYTSTLRSIYEQRGWSKERVTDFVVSLYRTCRPEVVVTQDVNGEYGHGAHRAAADAAQRAVALAADEAYLSNRAEGAAPWQVKKLYLHLYEAENRRMDWRVPLEAFGGKTALEVAAEAFSCHKSQNKGYYHVEDSGPNDNASFGLAFSLVGEDIQRDDFMEHIE